MQPFLMHRNMKTIKVTSKDRELLKKLIKAYNKIYGNPKTTIWDIQDLEELRRIGEEFIRLTKKYL